MTCPRCQQGNPSHAKFLADILARKVGEPVVASVRIADAENRITELAASEPERLKKLKT
jgi:hypothetical protein